MLRTYKTQEGERTYNIEGEFYHFYDDGFFLAPEDLNYLLKVFYYFQVTYITFYFLILSS